MNTTTQLLLARFKEKHGLTSDNQAAVRLRVSRQCVSRWQNGLTHAEPDSAERMALDLGLEPSSILAAIEADRAKNDAIRKVWARYGKSAFMALLVGLGTSVVPPASVEKAQTVAHVTSHYAKRRKQHRETACA